MSEPENFLTRWSRRKQDVAKESAKQEAKPNEPASQAGPGKAQAVIEPKVAPEAPAPVDLSTLPSLEEITAETDVTAFLKPGVPADLARAALRRAWTSDPAVRD